MRKKLKAVLFDMDGVLFNSMPYHSEAWHQVMKTHGLDLSREEAYMLSLIHIYMQDVNPQKLHQDICGINKKYKLELTNPSVNDVTEWINKLK